MPFIGPVTAQNCIIGRGAERDPPGTGSKGELAKNDPLAHGIKIDPDKLGTCAERLGHRNHFAQIRRPFEI